MNVRAGPVHHFTAGVCVVFRCIVTCILAPERPFSSLIVWPPVPMTRPTCACATYHVEEEVGRKRRLVNAARGLDRG